MKGKMVHAVIHDDGSTTELIAIYEDVLDATKRAVDIAIEALVQHLRDFGEDGHADDIENQIADAQVIANVMGVEEEDVEFLALLLDEQENLDERYEATSKVLPWVTEESGYVEVHTITVQ